MSLGVVGDPLAVKRGLGQFALTAPEFTFAGQQPLAQRPLRLPQPIVLDELAILVDQNLLDQVGMVGEHDMPGPESGRDEVAILSSPASHGPQLVAAELFQVAEEPVARRAGRTPGIAVAR